MHVLVDIPEENLEKLQATLVGMQGRLVEGPHALLEEWVRAKLDVRLAEDEATDVPLEAFLDRFRERGL
jgi:hypothetical protein